MHFFDKSRIKDEVETRLGRVVSITWNPFGRGWFFEKNERHYDVTYVDRSGQTITTACKTSLFTGVYWADGPQLSEPPPRIMSRHRLCEMRILDSNRMARLPQLRQGDGVRVRHDYCCRVNPAGKIFLQLSPIGWSGDYCCSG